MGAVFAPVRHPCIAANGTTPQQPAPSQPNRADLPDDALAKVFQVGEFELPARHACLALVSRQFARVVDDPLLLADVEHVFVPLNLASSLANFRRFLEPRGRHVRRLRLKLHARKSGQPRGQAAEALESLVACVAACPNLEELEIETNYMELPLGDWVALPRGLRRLKLDGAQASPVRVLASLEGLAGLQELAIDVSQLESWYVGARLPPSLTSLKIGGLKKGVSLPKLSGLTRLKELRLGGMCLPAEEYGDLAALTRVTRLTLASNDKLPACLGGMTWLRALQISSSPLLPSMAATYTDELLEAALAPLTGLTSLVLLHLRGASGLVPRAVQGMRLDTLYLEADPDWQASPANSVPGGALMASLRRLGLPAEVALAGGSDVLAAAPQLEALELNSGYRLPGGPSMAALLDGAAQHPTLRMLSLAGSMAGRMAHTLGAAVDSAGQADCNSGLQICHGYALKEECAEAASGEWY